MNQVVYVVVDIMDIPMFEADLNHFEDVTALCSKLFIFNECFTIQEQFAAQMIKLGCKI